MALGTNSAAGDLFIRGFSFKGETGAVGLMCKAHLLVYHGCVCPSCGQQDWGCCPSNECLEPEEVLHGVRHASAKIRGCREGG